jgi:hypothetical protein
MAALEKGEHMSITKLKTVGRWGSLASDLTRVGTHLGGRRVITGMLTGTDGPPDDAQAAAADASGARPGAQE